MQKSWVMQNCRFASIARRGWVYLNCKLAAEYQEMDRQQVENLARQNPYPFSSWFGGQNKVFIPFGVAPIDDEQQEIVADKSVQDCLGDEGYQVIDYRGGYCQKGNRKQRIGKVIQSLKKNALEEVKQQHQRGEVYNLERTLKETAEYFDGVLSNFLNSPLRAQKKAKTMEVVISQDPHDIATMSTGRSWTSCMEMGEGSHHRDVFCEVTGGGLVAYLLGPNDREINNPLARIHIRRFDNKHGQSIAIPEESVYGNEVAGFQETVKRWIDAMQPDIQPGMYERKGGEYSDTFGDETLVGPKKKEDILNWFEGKVQDAVYSEFVVTDEMYEDLEEYDENLGEEYGINNLSRKFKTRQEAENWVMEEDSESDRETVSEEWSDFDEEKDDWVKNRFSIDEKMTDNRRRMKEHATFEILKAEPDAYADEVINEIKSFVFESGSMGLVKTFVKKYPEKITPEEFSELGKRDSIDFVKALPEEKKAPYLESWLRSINETIDNPEAIVGPEEKKDLQEIREMEATGRGNMSPFRGGPLPIDVKKKGVLARVSLKLHDLVLSPLTALFSPIPENMSRKLVDLFSNLEERTGVPFSEFNEYEDREIAGLIHSFHMTHTDTPTVQNFYESLLPKWTDRVPGNKWERKGPICLENLGAAIGSLGINGKRFLPFLNQKLEEERSILEEKKEQTASPRTINQAEANIEKLLYIIDAIQSGTGYSSKYRFH